MSNLYTQSYHGGAGECLYLNEEFSDVVIIVKGVKSSSWRFPVHSLLLSAQSPVFRRTLHGEFAEKTSHTITIEDLDPLAVKQLLRYIYCGNVKLENWHEGIDLLHAAHKYQVEPLVEHCNKYLENVITIDNVCYIYKDASVYSSVTLKEKCLKVILDAGFVVLRRKSFEILNKEAIVGIVADPNLNVDTELIVIEALLRWAPLDCCRSNVDVNESNILRVLEPFLQHICFDDMSDTDKSALPSVILSCLKPNNRTRVAYYVPESLLTHAYYLDFQLDHKFERYVMDSLNCIRFSVDFPLYMIGLSLVIITPEFPQLLPLIMNKENNSNTTNIFSLNLSLIAWKEGVMINDRRHYRAKILLRQPFRLEAKAVYRLFMTDRSHNVQCPRTTLYNYSMYTTSGCINIGLHSDDMWGVQQLIFI